MIIEKVTVQILQVLTVNRSEPTFNWVIYSDIHNKNKKFNPTKTPCKLPGGIKKEYEIDIARYFLW